MDQIQTLKTEIESLKAAQQKEKHYLRDTEIPATADALVQSQAVFAESLVIGRESGGIGGE